MIVISKVRRACALMSSSYATGNLGNRDFVKITSTIKHPLIATGEHLANKSVFPHNIIKTNGLS